MAKLTLLKITNSILSSMDSDEINSINDTEEALQVARVVEEVYLEIMSQKDWPHLKLIRELDGLSDSTKPNFLQIPTGVSEIRKVKYDTSELTDTSVTISDINYLHPEDFIALVHQRRSDDSTVQTVTTAEGIPLFIFNNKSPRHWTSFDEDLLVFDAFDNTVDTTLQGSKSIVFAVKIPTFSQTDTHVPDLPESMFPLLLAEAKRSCHLYFKQQDSVMDAKRSLRGFNRMKSESWRAHDPRKVTDFGRAR